MLLCLMFMMLFYPCMIQVEFKTHVEGLMVQMQNQYTVWLLLSWWFSHGGSLRVSITLSLTVSCLQGFVSGCCPKRLLVKKNIDFLYMRHWTCLVGGGLTMRDYLERLYRERLYLERLYLERLLWAIRK